MEYAVLSPDTQKTFQEIQQRIRRLQNWGSIASLKNLGLPSGNQVGASFVSLKQLASSYSPDEQLAFLLWNTQKREEQIIACLLLPKKINKEKITQLIQNCYNFEVAEYLGSFFLYNFEKLTEIATEWINSEKPYMQIAALTACARHLILFKFQPAISKDFFNNLIHNDYKDKYVQLVARRYR